MQHPNHHVMKRERKLHDFIPAVSTAHGVGAIATNEVLDTLEGESADVLAVGFWAVVIHTDLAVECALAPSDAELNGAVSVSC
jgi:hypothetical protein